jgi:hypothetical protein
MIDKTALVQGYYRKMPVKKAKSKNSRPRASCSNVVQCFAACFLLFVVMAWPAPAEGAKIQYKFKSWNGSELRVYLTRPVGLAPDRPVVFVMHGANREADKYREQWHELAIKNDFLLVAPEISRADSPGSEKDHLGNLFVEQGALKADSILSYSAIEAVFNDVRSRFNLSVDTYSLYGDSEGAQFVQRFVFYAPTARVNRIVVANADWYMMPDFDVAFPYGLGQSAIDPSQLKKGLQRPVTILLGEEDPETDYKSLRQTPGMMAQGANRLARGQAFFESARGAAVELGVPFNWHLEKVEEADTDNPLMAPAAIPFLLGDD